MWRETRGDGPLLYGMREAHGRGCFRGDCFSRPAERLRRILAGKKIAGVCAGFAEYFGADITLMRIIWVALLLLPPHIGLFAYIVAWAVLPKS